MKLSILMPTFNDKDSICETLDSLIEQTYHNWELIIIDDGSTDGVKETIENYKKVKDNDNQIKYFRQENADQLKAIIAGIEHISGDYVFVLHSDDLLGSSDVFEKCTTYFKRHADVDAIISDLIIIDECSSVTGMQQVLTYKNLKSVPPMQLLWLGRNLYVDVAFYRKDVFLDKVKNNYLIWNMPFWLSINNDVNMLNVKKVDFPLIKYRVHGGNYINNDIGKLNVINGELRVAINLMKFYSLPFYKSQYVIFRLFNKLNLLNLYKPIYFNIETKNKTAIIKFIIEKRYNNSYKNNLFLNSLFNFYNNYKERVIFIDHISTNETIYLGNMIRLFNKNLLNNNLSEFYISFLKEMEQGFSEIIVTTDLNKRKMEDITKFFCIDKSVRITKK